jgi:hypothetical protein
MDPNWHKTYVPGNGHLFSYIMDNVWNCNYPLWQGGITHFTYRVTTHRGACNTAQAARFGWGHASPLLARRVDKQAGSLLEKSFQAVSLDAGNVMLTALKKAEDGNGWIIRLYETEQNVFYRLKTQQKPEIKAIISRILALKQRSKLFKPIMIKKILSEDYSEDSIQETLEIMKRF